MLDKNRRGSDRKWHCEHVSEQLWETWKASPTSRLWFCACQRVFGCPETKHPILHSSWSWNALNHNLSRNLIVIKLEFNTRRRARSMRNLSAACRPHVSTKYRSSVTLPHSLGFQGTGFESRMSACIVFVFPFFSPCFTFVFCLPCCCSRRRRPRAMRAVNSIFTTCVDLVCVSDNEALRCADP